jgi:hypothetical protein
VAIAYLQEFKIEDGDTSTTNYDAVAAALNLQTAPDDVWETREQGETFINDQLNPIIEPMAVAAAERGDDTFAPPSRETWYELHDSMTG